LTRRDFGSSVRYAARKIERQFSFILYPSFCILYDMDCIFCKIVAGKLPASRVYEDDATLAFLDINPVNPGHTLVIPKRHSKNIFEVSKEDWVAVAETVRIIAAAVESGLGADGINLEMNNRELAGQLVDHTHVHVIPRHKGDGLKHFPHSKYQEGESERTLARIRLVLH
jgi:histidine triad (HIT) family protein